VLCGCEEDHGAEFVEVLGVVGEVGVHFEVEVYVQVLYAHDGDAVGVFLLVDHQQSDAVLLPFGAFDVDQHFGAGHEDDVAVVVVEAPFQLFKEERVDFHLNL
jgi:hypothetical protein